MNPKEDRGAWLVGITGNSGCGQTTAAEAASEYCRGVCSLDVTGHRLLDRPYVVSDLARSFYKPELLRLRGDSLRSELRRTVFSDPVEMDRLNSILHPRMKRWAAISAAKLRLLGTGIWILEGALIFEMGLDSLFDLVMVISDTPERSAKRVAERDGITVEEALIRWDHQMSLPEKESAADIVIRNSGTEDDIRGVIGSIFARM